MVSSVWSWQRKPWLGLRQGVSLAGARDLEQLLQGSLNGNAGSPGLEPGLAERLQQRLAETTRRQEMLGEPAVLLVPPTLRQTLARFVRAGVPGLQVLAWNEIPDNRRVRLVSAVGR